MRVDFLISSDGFGVLALDPHTSCIFNEILGGVLFAGFSGALGRLCRQVNPAQNCEEYREED
jgi:hypothetical protein